MQPTIAYVLKMYPRFSETFIVNEILELERRGVAVRIYSLHKPDDGRFHAKLARVRASVVYVPQYPEMEPERIQAAHTRLAAAEPARYAAVKAWSEARGHPYAVKRFLQAGFIAAHLLDHPVTALHAHFASSATRAANLVWRLTGIPYSFTAHAKDIFHDSVTPDSLREKCRDARFVVTVSRFNQHYLQALLGDVPGDIRHLYNGIDVTEFTPGAAGSRSAGLILAIGRLVEKKGFDVLINACRLLADRGSDFVCHIIGQGEQHDALARRIAEHGLSDRVLLVGPRPQDEVAAAYREAAVFALPCVVGSDGNRDGLPTVLLEAMASGVPVVSTDVTGIPEIIDDGVNGVIVPQRDAAALADALAALLADPQRRAALGAAGRAKVEAVFSVRANVAQLQRWLAEPVPPACEPYYPHETVVTSPYAPLTGSAE